MLIALAFAGAGIWAGFGGFHTIATYFEAANYFGLFGYLVLPLILFVHGVVLLNSGWGHNLKASAIAKRLQSANRTAMDEMNELEAEFRQTAAQKMRTKGHLGLVLGLLTLAGGLYMGHIFSMGFGGILMALGMTQLFRASDHMSRTR